MERGNNSKSNSNMDASRKSSKRKTKVRARLFVSNDKQT